MTVDESGDATGYTDVFKRFDACRAHYRSVGLGNSYIDKLIR